MRRRGAQQDAATEEQSMSHNRFHGHRPSPPPLDLGSTHCAATPVAPQTLQVKKGGAA